MEIRSLAPIAAGPRGLDALAATAAPPPTIEPTPSESVTLDPPVRVDIGSSGREARFVRDSDTATMVFQVVDPTFGDVVVQSPTESTLRNRAYEAARAQHRSASLSRTA